MRQVAVAEDFHGLDVVSDGSHLVITFRWKSNPTSFGVRIPLPEDPPESPWTGLPIDSLDEFVSDLVGLLGEELGTGIVYRAERVPRDGYVELVHPVPWQPDRSEFYLKPVDPREVPWSWAELKGRLRSRADGLLISWTCAVTNDEHTRFLGQARLSWDASRPLVARLGAVEVEDGVPSAVLTALARGAVHDAADAGASLVVTTQRHSALLGIGFRPVPGGDEWAIAAVDA
ncbi:hypothetical protein Ahu01nite_005940 [Winogradskya humida]|uniref:GNAT family N-acetyltransferase n=2 Tax=Winogradskya humida TaxID=113566 RepID=A0ABQ3ZFZ6_9ACTN|nr:hypothetical protein Ahu01nite_005940 [Actinoplanes humidus]